MTNATTTAFERARRLAGRCRIASAIRACSEALKENPGLLRASALMWRLEAGLGRISVDDAKGRIQLLVQADPADPYLQVQAAAVLAPKASPKNATAALRAVAQDFDDPYVHQSLAGALGCDMATWPEAWQEYKLAMRQGPLLTTRIRGAAYYLASHLEPGEKMATLAGTSAVERSVVRTRATGLAELMLLLVLGIIGSLVAFLAHATPIGVGILVVATLLALWISYSNAYVGCWKCAVVWLVFAGLPWAVVAWAAADRSGRLIAGGALVGMIVGWAFPAVGQVVANRRKLRALAVMRTP